MTDEKAKEYQQIAAILAGGISLLAEIARGESQNLKRHIERLEKEKDRVISDPEYRLDRWRAACFLQAHLDNAPTDGNAEYSFPSKRKDGANQSDQEMDIQVVKVNQDDPQNEAHLLD